MPVTPILVVTQTISGDLDTPVSAYLKLAPTRGFLFESVVGGESVARYSIIGCRPLVEYRAVSDGVHISSGRDSHFVAGNPIDVIQSDFDRYQPNESGGPFPNGLFGFFAWEIIGQIEKIQCREKPGLGIPLGEFFIPGTLVVFDHAKRVIVIVAMSIGDAAEAHAEIDLRVDDHTAPIAELRRIFDLFWLERRPYYATLPTRLNPAGIFDPAAKAWRKPLLNALLLK